MFAGDTKVFEGDVKGLGGDCKVFGVTVEVFLGLNDLSEEGNWVFSTGDAYDIQFPWYYTEPNNGGEGGDQDCGMFAFESAYILTSYLYDQECHELRYFICEFVN